MNADTVCNYFEDLLPQTNYYFQGKFWRIVTGIKDSSGAWFRGTISTVKVLRDDRVEEFFNDSDIFFFLFPGNASLVLGRVHVESGVGFLEESDAFGALYDVYPVDFEVFLEKGAIFRNCPFEFSHEVGIQIKKREPGLIFFPPSAKSDEVHMHEFFLEK